MSDSLQPHGLYCPWNSPGQNPGVGSLYLLQEILPTQKLNPGLPHCRQILNHWTTKETPRATIFKNKRKTWKRRKPSLVVHLVKNPPAMQGTWVQSQDWEDLLEKRKATHSRILAWRIPWLYSPWGHKELDTTERLSLCV